MAGFCKIIWSMTHKLRMECAIGGTTKIYTPMSTLLLLATQDLILIILPILEGWWYLTPNSTEQRYIWKVFAGLIFIPQSKICPVVAPMTSIFTMDDRKILVSLREQVYSFTLITNYTRRRSTLLIEMLLGMLEARLFDRK